MVRPPKKRVYNFENSEPERLIEPIQDVQNLETPQEAESNVEDVTIQTQLKEDVSSIELVSEMKDAKMSLDASETSSAAAADTSLQEAGESQSLTPTKSRFGRSHKPKVLGDFVSTDKKVSIVLKVSPVNQFKYYKDNRNNFAPKVRHERRGRPRKSLIRESFGKSENAGQKTDSPTTQKTPSSPSKQRTSPSKPRTTSPSKQTPSKPKTSENSSQKVTSQINESSSTPQKITSQITEKYIASQSTESSSSTQNAESSSQKKAQSSESSFQKKALSTENSSQKKAQTSENSSQKKAQTSESSQKKAAQSAEAPLANADLDVKVDPVEMEPDPGCEWMVGDLAWARIGNHPFWPCIIARDPELGIFTRIRMFTKSLVPHRRLHVQFFGDNGRRSWLSSTSVMNYTGRAAFEELSQSILSAMKRKDPRQVSALVVKPNLKSVWESAVNEAESLLDSSREERVLHFKRLVKKMAMSQKVSAVEGEEGQASSQQRVKRQYRKRKADSNQGDPDYVVASKQIKLDADAVVGESSASSPVLTPRKRGRPRKTLSPVKQEQQSVIVKQEPGSPSGSTRPVRLSRTAAAAVVKMEVDDSVESGEAESTSIDGTADSEDRSKKKFRTPPARSSEQMRKARNKKAKLGAELNKFTSKQINKISSKNPEMGVRQVEIRLEKMWKDLDEAQKSRYRSKANGKDKQGQADAGEGEGDEEDIIPVTWDPTEDTDEKTSTSEISESPLTLPAPTTAKARTKVSIFNGAFQGKVCQVCEKPGNTFRCKGPCCGTYHVDCAANPRDFSARIKEIFQAVKAPSSSDSPGGVAGRKKKVDGRGRRKSSLVAKEGGEEGEEEGNKEGEEEEEKRKEDEGKLENGDVEDSSTSGGNGEKVDGRRKSVTESESKEESENVDGKRRKSLAEKGDNKEEPSEEKTEKVDGRRRKSVVEKEGESKEESEEKTEKVDGRRRKSLVSNENKELEEPSANEKKIEKVDGRRRKSVTTGDVEEEVITEEKKEKIDGRRKSVVKVEGEEETVTNEEVKTDGRRRKSITTENKEEPSKSEGKVEKIDEKKSTEEIEEDKKMEMVDEKKKDEEGTSKNEEKSKKIDDLEGEVEPTKISETKEKLDGRRRKSLVKNENVDETEANEEKLERRRTRGAVNKESGNEANKDEVKEVVATKEKVDGRRKKSLVKVESVEKEEVDESTTDSDVKVGKKGRKGGGKESCGDSSEEADSQGADFRCAACSEGRLQACFVCGQDEFNGESARQRCHVAHCGRVYHLECLKAWPQVNWMRSAGVVRGGGGGEGGGKGAAGAFACPQHACHTCISDNPSVMKERFANDRLVKCLRCPASYHYGNHCLPAGTEIIAARQIICPQHSKKHKKGLHHVNASWCFICASGGSLICCDMCPTAFHADCLKISPPEGGYICEDCETGRFPLYGEIVWVKLGVYRWWPAQIMFPHHIPPNIRNLVHARGEFAVKFFGSHDFYWVNRGRVFLYQEGDSGGRCNSKRKGTDQMFLRAVEEASEACMRLKNEKASREATNRSGMKPPSYIRIKTNKPVGQVRAMEANISSLTPCECDPNSANPCALDTDCLNRILMIECNPLICPAGERCKNQQFEKREYPPLMPYRTEGRGWGLKTLVDLKKGEFVIEYVGEMINEVEYQRRLQKMHESNENNYYFLTIDKDRMLDAGPKGNVARFMNHSCQPNCETQKWTVNGDTRVGLFALHDIAAETELVFNYNLESIGTEKKPCMCGAPNCSGFIGVKASKNGNGIHADESVLEKQKKPRRRSSKQASAVKLSDEVCFICQQGGQDLLLCDGKHCTKAYHLNCLSRNKKHPVGYWLCPWHQCNVCSRGKVYRCNFCINSYCPTHAEGNIRREEAIGYVCTKHGCTKGDKSKTDDKTKPAICDSTAAKSSESAAAISDVPIQDQLLSSESASSSTMTSSASSSIVTSEEKQNNNVVESAKVSVKSLSLSRTRRARSNSDANLTTTTSAKTDDNEVKLLRRIRRPASVDSLTVIKESELPLKETVLRNAVLKRRRSWKGTKEEEVNGVEGGAMKKENGELNVEPKELNVEGVATSENLAESNGVGVAPSENSNVIESNGIEMNGHDSLESVEDSLKVCESSSTNEKDGEVSVDDSTCKVDEKVTSEEVLKDGKVNGEVDAEEEMVVESQEELKEDKIVENERVKNKPVDEEMECESADKVETETIDNSDGNCDSAMEVTEEIHSEVPNEADEVPSCNEKSTKDESCSEEVSKEKGDESRAKVNGILDEWSDDEPENGEIIVKKSSDSVADNETSDNLVDKSRLDTVSACNSEETNGEANVSNESVKKCTDSVNHILPEDQDSLVT